MVVSNVMFRDSNHGLESRYPRHSEFNDNAMFVDRSAIFVNIRIIYIFIFGEISCNFVIEPLRVMFYFIFN